MARDPTARSDRRELYMPASAVRNPQVRGLLPGEGKVRTVTAGAATSLPPAPRPRKVAVIAPHTAAQPAGRERRFVTPATGPFLALPSGSSPRSQRGHLERAYDAFISTGSVATLRPMV